MSQNTVSQLDAFIGQSHDFATIPGQDLPRSAYDRSSSLTTTCDGGKLYPIYADEIVPGDTIVLTPHVLARMSTPIWPVMANLFAETWFFFVPNRLLWTNFKKMMGEQVNPGDSTNYITPVITSPTNGFSRAGLMDYFGVPPQATSGTTHSVAAWWSRAYNLIWNEWFRDENLQNSITVDTGDGPDSESNYIIRARGKRKDYYSSALPYPQKWTAQSLPLGTSAPVDFTLSTTNGPQFQIANGTKWGTLEAQNGVTTPTLQLEAGAGTFNAGENLYWKQLGFSATANLSGATAATVNDLRLAFMLQAMSERDARGGTRYVEIVQAHFGISNAGGDARFQRPEYLGGGKINISVNPVPTTSEDAVSARSVGNLGAFAVGVGSTDTIVRSFTEHGVIVGLINLTTPLEYQQGTERMFNRSSKYDYYWPGLAFLGEQPILNKEIYTDGTANDLLTWGYAERWSEMRFKHSKVTGKFRTSDPGTLDAWHLAQNFTSRPSLNSTYIEDAPPIGRVVAVPTEPHFFVNCFFECTHIRPMPTYSVPWAMGRF